MPHPFTLIGPIHTHTYTLLLGVGLFVTIVYASTAYRFRFATPIGHVVDVCLAGLIGGVFLARVFHVVLNWTYFAVHPGEIRFIEAGGLNWHGAVIGGLLAMSIMARLRKINLNALLHYITVVLPIMVFLVWWGCGANHCAFGTEVDNLSRYPAWLAWERHDINNIILPRYATQPLGMLLGFGLLVLNLFSWLIWRRSLSFWLMLILLSLGLFVIGFLRSDHSQQLMRLRLDQWLDLMMVILGLYMAAKSRGSGYNWRS